MIKGGKYELDVIVFYQMKEYPPILNHIYIFNKIEIYSFAKKYVINISI